MSKLASAAALALVASLFPFAAQATPSVTSGLIAAYEFSGNANDSSGNGFNATVNGATLTTDRSGNANSAYFFNGNSSIYSTISSLPLGAGARTVTAWVRTDSLSGSHAIFASGESNCTGQEFGLTTNNSTLWAWGGCQDAAASFSTPLSTWAFVALSYDGSAYTMTVNNNSQSATVGALSTASQAFSIGAAASGNNSSFFWGFNGAIDDVYVYNRALSAAEITSVRDQTSAAPEPGVLSLAFLGLLGLAASRRRA